MFKSSISSLYACLDDITSSNVDPNIFIRGDANVNPKNTSRVHVLNHLLDKHNLKQVDLKHPTYHHFLGQGEFDSSLDVILYVKKADISENIEAIICKHQHPLVQSHHDLILSSFSTPVSCLLQLSPQISPFLWVFRRVLQQENILKFKLLRETSWQSTK